MIDIHCHILPGMDDGPDTLEASTEMARLASAHGTKILVATPHQCNEEDAQQVIEDRVADLNVELKARGIALDILPGSENCIFMEPSLARVSGINRGDYVLVEFPHAGIPAGADRMLFDLVMTGAIPVIAHPERNVSVLRNPSIVSGFMDAGAVVQVTADSVTGLFGRQVMECAHYLLKKGLVYVLASDGHGTSRRRPVLSAGLEAAREIIGKGAADRLVHENPARVISSQPL